MTTKGENNFCLTHLNCIQGLSIMHRPLFMPHPEIQVGVLGERYPEIPGTNPLYTPTF